MNVTVIIGRLVKEVDLRYTTSGQAVAKFTLAVDKEMPKDKKQEAINQGKPTADFINVSVFGKQAESCANYLKKGSMCAVQGRINTSSYTTQTGEKRYTTDVIANRVEFIGSKQEDVKTKGVELPDASVFDDVFEPVNSSDIPF